MSQPEPEVPESTTLPEKDDQSEEMSQPEPEAPQPPEAP